MSILQAIIIGIIQGLTEFIPISSTAHMTITAKLSGVMESMTPEQWTAFMAVVQLGTLAAVFVYFAGDIKSILTSFIRDNITNRVPYSNQSAESKQGWLIVLGSVPIVVIGLALKKLIEGEFTKDITVIATMLLLISLVMYFAERFAKQRRVLSDVTLKDTLLIGCAQAIAVLPGSSRSGTTISAGLFLGLTRESSARFSFLLSIPAIAGSGLLQLVKSVKDISPDSAVSLAVCTLVAGVTGYVAIAFLMRFLRSNSMMIFIVYRVILALILLLWMR
jgi:undecaprenyl-diphosphatase